jgi:hypothetical protein
MIKNWNRVLSCQTRTSSSCEGCSESLNAAELREGAPSEAGPTSGAAPPAGAAPDADPFWVTAIFLFLAAGACCGSPTRWVVGKPAGVPRSTGVDPGASVGAKRTRAGFRCAATDGNSTPGLSGTRPTTFRLIGARGAGGFFGGSFNGFNGIADADGPRQRGIWEVTLFPRPRAAHLQI